MNEVKRKKIAEAVTVIYNDFNWAGSPQGYAYWSTVCENLRKIKEPPEPTTTTPEVIEVVNYADPRVDVLIDRVSKTELTIHNLHADLQVLSAKVGHMVDTQVKLKKGLAVEQSRVARLQQRTWDAGRMLRRGD